MVPNYHKYKNENITVAQLLQETQNRDETLNWISFERFIGIPTELHQNNNDDTNDTCNIRYDTY